MNVRRIIKLSVTIHIGPNSCGFCHIPSHRDLLELLIHRKYQPEPEEDPRNLRSRNLKRFPASSDSLSPSVSHFAARFVVPLSDLIMNEPANDDVKYQEEGNDKMQMPASPKQNWIQLLDDGTFCSSQCRTDVSDGHHCHTC
jgi:hypothetical protein